MRSRPCVRSGSASKYCSAPSTATAARRRTWSASATRATPRARRCAASTAIASRISSPKDEDLDAHRRARHRPAGRRRRATTRSSGPRCCALRACARARRRACVVLDRPNPIGGARETSRDARRCTGFLLVRRPRAHARFATRSRSARSSRWRARGREARRRRARDRRACEGWDRERTRRRWDRPFVMPSPNMPTLETALVYPGRLPARGHEPLRGPRHDAPVRDRRRAVDRRRARSRASSPRRTCPGFVARPLHLPPTFQKHAGRPAAACRST